MAGLDQATDGNPAVQELRSVAWGGLTSNFTQLWFSGQTNLFFLAYSQNNGQFGAFQVPYNSNTLPPVGIPSAVALTITNAPASLAGLTTLLPYWSEGRYCLMGYNSSTGAVIAGELTLALSPLQINLALWNNVQAWAPGWAEMTPLALNTSDSFFLAYKDNSGWDDGAEVVGSVLTIDRPPKPGNTLP